MTWAEFKARVESQGVGDNDEIFYIDVERRLPEDRIAAEDIEVTLRNGGWGIG